MIWCFHCERHGTHQTKTCHQRMAQLHRGCRVFWHNVAVGGALCAAYGLGRRSAGSIHG